MQSSLSPVFWFDPAIKNSKQQNVQVNRSFVASDETTFIYLPKRPKFIGLSTPITNRVSSRNMKGYKKRGLFLCNIDPVAYNSTIDPRPYTCFNCWSPDHRLIECPEPLTDIFCCNCGRRYLKIEECPRCSREFWELDKHARQWLSTYISVDNQEVLTECSETDWSKYKENSSDSFCIETESGKYNDSKDDYEREDLTKCETNSRLTLKTSDRDESENGDWWDCNKSKDEIVEEKIDPTMTKKEKANVEDTNLFVNEKNRDNEESLQVADTKADSVVEPQLNSFGETSISTQSDEEDEDYDNIIIDEDEQMEESCIVGNTVRDFLDLFKAAKYLPLQQQHTIVLRFASQCKEKF